MFLVLKHNIKFLFVLCFFGEKKLSFEHRLWKLQNAFKQKDERIKQKEILKEERRKASNVIQGRCYKEDWEQYLPRPAQRCENVTDINEFRNRLAK